MEAAVSNEESAIRNTLGRWCQLADERDAAGLVALWTEGGSFAAPALDISSTGHAELESLFRSWFLAPGARPENTKHVVTNSEIHCDSETAWVSSDFVTIHRGAGPAEISTAGRFVDRLVRADGAWLLSERTSFTGHGTPPRDLHAIERAEAIDRSPGDAILLRIAQYNQSLKDGRLDDLVDCWTDDGVFTALGVSHEGRNGIREFLAPHSSTEGHLAIGGGHLVANTALNICGDNAEAQTDMITIARIDDGWQVKGSVGRYVDELVRDGRVWRFARRTNVTTRW